MITVTLLTNAKEHTKEMFTNHCSFKKNSCGGFCPAGSEPHLSPGGIHRLSFYQIIRSLVIGNHQKEKNHQNWSQLVLSGTIHLPGGPMM